MGARSRILVLAAGLGAAGLLVAVFGLSARPPAAVAQAKPVRVIVGAMPAEQLEELRQAAPTGELVVARNQEEALRLVADADGCVGFISPALIRAGKKLRWVQSTSAGVENYMFPELVNSKMVLTNAQRVYGPEIADQAMGYLLCFTRGLSHYIRAQREENWDRNPGFVLDELQGKTVVIIGLGGIGSEVARRAHAFGMRVLATDPKVVEKPAFVAELHKPDALRRLLPQADVLVSAVPLTPVTRKMIGEREIALLKRTAILINVSRGGVVDTDALVKALEEKRVAAAGLDVTDPEPLPKGHPLWKMANVVITPHIGGQSPGARQRLHELVRENIRRFAAGETLKNIVDKQAGY